MPPEVIASQVTNAITSQVIVVTSVTQVEISIQCK